MLNVSKGVESVDWTTRHNSPFRALNKFMMFGFVASQTCSTGHFPPKETKNNTKVNEPGRNGRLSSAFLGQALLGVLCVRNDCLFIKTNLEPQNALVPGAVGAVERPQTRGRGSKWKTGHPRFPGGAQAAPPFCGLTRSTFWSGLFCQESGVEQGVVLIALDDVCRDG